MRAVGTVLVLVVLATVVATGAPALHIALQSAELRQLYDGHRISDTTRRLLQYDLDLEENGAGAPTGTGRRPPVTEEASDAVVRDRDPGAPRLRPARSR